MIPTLERRRSPRSTSRAGGTRRISTARSRSTRRSRRATRAQELPRGRALEPRRLGRRTGRQAGRPVRLRDGRVLPGPDPGSVVRAGLKDQGAGELPRGAYLRHRLEPLAARTTLAPEQATPRRVALLPGRRSSPSSRPPAMDDHAFDAYVSDPANPVPYRPRPNPRPTSARLRMATWLVQDQRFVDHRPDVLSYETEPLAEDVTVAGEIVAHLFASTSGIDSDWIVKLIDVYPEDDPTDWHLLRRISSSSERGLSRPLPQELREARADPARPGARIQIDLHTKRHTLQEGAQDHGAGAEHLVPAHRPQSADLRAQHLQGDDADFRPATQRIFRSARYPSHVTIPVARHGGCNPGDSR